MPIYEYQCEACQDICEKIMKFSDPHPETCNACGKGPMTKLMSPSSFHLKGGGWYSDGYDSKSNQKPSEKPKDSPKEKASPATTEKSKDSSPKKAAPQPAAAGGKK